MLDRQLISAQKTPQW